MQQELFRRQRLTTSIVPSDGPTDANIYFIGEAPGEEEDRGLKPFIGSAGQLLMTCFRQVQISRNEVLLTNVFSQRPPDNNIGYFFYDKSCTKPTPEGLEHIESLQRWLQERLSERPTVGGPNLLVAFGGTALSVLTGRSPISKLRGSILPCSLVEGFKVYPAFHPSYVQRLMNEPREVTYGNQKKKALQKNVLPIMLMDLQRIKEEAEFPEIRAPKRNIRIIANMQEALEVFSYLETTHTIAVDIETLPSSTGPLVWCIGLAPNEEEAFVFPILRDFTFFWRQEEEATIWKRTSDLFLNPEIQKVFQNGSYDLSILGRQYGLRVANGTYDDTMLCHQMLYPYLPKGLDFLASVYTKEPYYKDDGKVWDGRRISDTAEFIYNGKDCCVTREIMPVTKYNIQKHRMRENYTKTLKVFPSVLRMQIRGVKIDLKKKDELSDYFSKKAAVAKVELKRIVGGDYNMNSPAQMNKLLYAVLDLPVRYNPKTKRATSDKDAINSLLQKAPRGSDTEAALNCIKTFREASKLSSTYTNMTVDYDGRIRTSYGWISTFRLSSSESHFGAGGNLQNIPKRSEEGRLIRQLFVPDDGFVFLAGDLRQAEAQEVAWLCEDIHKIQLFQMGHDVHWHNAKLIFGIPDTLPYDPNLLWEDIITELEHKLKIFRDIGKTVMHATNYKMGPIMLQTILSREGFFLPQITCKRLLGSVLANSPFLERWHRDTIEEVKATRRLVNALGDTREFFGRLNDELFRSAIAFRPQSVVGRICQLGIQKIHSMGEVVEPLLNVHDEVLCQCREEDIPEVMERIRGAMEIPHEIRGRELTIPVDFKWGHNWGEMTEL